jgi:malate dehydrogenase (oxaloacetate-decarboxylating)(NADP+)
VKSPMTGRGLDLLHDPLLNKGTCFSQEERSSLRLHGLLPPRVLTVEQQIHRLQENYGRLNSDLDRYVFLEAVHDRNETLFYRFLLDNLAERTPIVYTPTVGAACENFGHLYRRNRGMYFPASLKGRFRELTENWPQDRVDIIVVTDGSRILGLGDLGTNGIGIPIGKISLYVACAGIHPAQALPAVIDVGTHNERLLKDPLYLGECHPRLTGQAYDELLEEFITAAHERWPGVLIQFEDFSNDHAFTLLNRYRDRLPCFNDDIQGTGAVALAGLLAALRRTGGSLRDQRIVFLGAGAAATGIADTIAACMADEGLSPEQARERFWLVDTHGLVTSTRGDALSPHKIPYARQEENAGTLLDVVKRVKPTALFGLSMQPGAFREDVVREMARHVHQPIIFALSNPTSKTECTPEQACRWTQGNAVYASGSPFPPVPWGDRELTPAQANNMYIFPGVGLGAILSGARKVTDAMFLAAARTLAGLVDDDTLQSGGLFPQLDRIRSVSAEIAAAVFRTACSQGVSDREEPADLLAFILERMYRPEYVPCQAEGSTT